MMTMIRRYLIAGLLVWVPILITIFIIRFIIQLMDQSLALLPKALQPEHLFGFTVPGMGLVLSIAILLFTGMLAANFLGQRLVRLWDSIVDRIPLVRSIYTAVKQVLETIFKPGGTAFRRVLLVEYPRKGLWSIAFQTGITSTAVSKHTQNEEMLTIFIPTTPNPTSGFLMFISKDDAIVLDMSVDQALKMVISLGVVQPDPSVLDAAAQV